MKLLINKYEEIINVPVVDSFTAKLKKFCSVVLLPTGINKDKSNILVNRFFEGVRFCLITAK